MWDPNKKITLFNHAFEHLTGRNADDVIGRLLHILFPHASRDKSLTLIEGTAGGKYWEAVEIPILRKDGEVRTVLWNSANLHADDGETLVATIAQGQDITERKRAEEALQKRTHDLGERVKELNCLYGISMHAEKQDISLEEILQEIVNLIPPGWQYPEITCARIVLEDRVFKTSNFKRTIWKQDAEMMAHGDKLGFLEVCYLEEKPETDEGPFLREERNLINDIAKRVGKITERKRGEEALRKSEKQASAAIEAARALTFRYDIATGKIDWGGAIEKITGYTPEEFAKVDIEDWADRIHPDDRDEILSILQEAMGKDRATAEYRFRTKKGYVTLSSISLTEKQDGKAVRLVGILQDITERKRAEEEIEAGRKKLENTFNSMIDGVSVTDVDGVIIQANEAVTKMYGCKSVKEMIGKRIFEFIANKEIPSVRKRYMESINKKEKVIRNLEIVGKRKDGSEFPVMINATNLWDEKGKFVGNIGVVRDITERKRAEEALRESEKLAATGRMAARIAHEINNPLGGIKNSFLLIKDAIPKDHIYYEYVGRIEKEIDRIAHIVHQMFDLYRQDQEPTKQFSVDETIRDVVALLESSCRQHQVNIELDTGGAPVVDAIPEGSIRQVLFNIIQNAIEASPPGKMVKVTAGASKNFFTLTVSDQGKGVPEKIRSHIFEPFFTTKSAEVTGGLGLGLSVSKSLVEAMGGSLDFESKTGKGTKFNIVLPMERLRKEEQNG